jgi:hypothetical protein
MKTKDLIKKIARSGVITEKEINLLKRRANAGEKMDLSPIYDNEIELTAEQNKKGYDFLIKQWKTPKGKERKNNPFGYREQKALETFQKIYFDEFYNAGNMYIDFYLPLYTVVGENSTFQYYYNGEVNIIG